MVVISLLTPALESAGPLTKDNLSEYLGTKHFKIYKLVPVENFEDCEDIVIRVESNFSLKSIEKLLEENKQLTFQIERSKEALLSYSSKIKQQFQTLAMNKTQRIKKLEKENIRLRENFK